MQHYAHKYIKDITLIISYPSFIYYHLACPNNSRNPWHMGTPW